MFEGIMEITVFAYQQNAHKKYLWDKDKRLGHYTKDDLEILIATMDREDLSFLEAIFYKPIERIEDQVLIINQSKIHTLSSPFENIRVINDIHYGLSRSRNLAIKESRGALLWLLDDDCKMVEDATHKIAVAHSAKDSAIITFQTISPEGKPVRRYEAMESSLSRKRVEKVLSPEITLKRSVILEKAVSFDLRFGLGAQFQDSENYLFLLDAMVKDLEVLFTPQTIVSHQALTSSDQADSKRIIYARGALAARKNSWSTVFYQFKYTFFLWRKGYVKNFKELIERHRLFGQGATDYFSGFKRHLDL